MVAATHLCVSHEFYFAPNSIFHKLFSEINLEKFILFGSNETTSKFRKHLSQKKIMLIRQILCSQIWKNFQTHAVVSNIFSLLAKQMDQRRTFNCLGLFSNSSSQDSDYAENSSQMKYSTSEKPKSKEKSMKLQL